MAKALRSSKKQPAFDPSELEDLIFSPAVGKGVGSHLVSRAYLSSTVATSFPPTVVMPVRVDTNTHDESGIDMTTVVSSPGREEAARAPGLTSGLPTVVTSGSLPSLPSVSQSVAPGASKLWITENGDLVPQARVKRIRLAQDVINSAEECVYDTLWNAKLIQTDERESCRIVQAGYDYLVKRSRLSRKTIQRIIAKLLEKDFISIETRADIYQRTSTMYRVFSYRAVLERHVKKGRLYVAKMGPGFSYAQPLNAKDEITGTVDMTTVGGSDVSTIAEMTTVAKETTVTVVKMDGSTVVKMSPYLLDSYVLDNTSSSTSSSVQAALATYGPIDDDVGLDLIAACRALAPDCSEAEIVHFIHEKGRYIKKREKRVHSPIGFLVTAVPKCFSGESFRIHRRRRQQSLQIGVERESEEQEAMEAWRREQEASLSDPAIPEQEKHLIRLCLGLDTS